MASSSVPQASSTRPTLPSIRTLCLPHMQPAHEFQRPHDLYDSHDLHTSTDVGMNWDRPRHASISSSTTSGSTSRPTTPSDDLPTPLPSSNFSLVRTTFDKANAVIVVPPTAADADAPSHAQAYLLVGRAMEQLRHPQRRLAKGARVHPYRIVPGARAARRASSSSTSTSLDAHTDA